jgi:cytochrome c2
MKVKLIFIGLVFLALFGSSLQSAFGETEALSPLLPGNPLEGSRLFTGKGCLRCHSVHGVGGVAGPDLGQGILNRPLLEIAGVMWNHSPGMVRIFQEQRAAFPKFTPQEMASLLAFLYYLGSLDAPGNPDVGARLFIEKRCQDCHSLGDKTASIVGPPLDRYSQYASPLFLTTALWNAGKSMAQAMEVLDLPRATFQGNDIPDLVAYIRSLVGGVKRVYMRPGNPQRGEKLFKALPCAQCHPVTDHSKGVGPDLRVKLKGSLMQIAGAMWNHGPKMWAKMTELQIDVPILTSEEMSDLISYLYFIQFIDPPGDVERGRRVYQQKRCAACHAFPEVGIIGGPDLAKVKMMETPLEVITAMWNHAGGMEEMMLKQAVAWPILKGGEMADLIAYLLSVRQGTR